MERGGHFDDGSAAYSWAGLRYGKEERGGDVVRAIAFTHSPFAVHSFGRKGESLQSYAIEAALRRQATALPVRMRSPVPVHQMDATARDVCSGIGDLKFLERMGAVTLLEVLRDYVGPDVMGAAGQGAVCISHFHKSVRSMGEF